MKYKILTAIKAGEFEGKYGKTIKYLMSLTDENGNEVGALINQKPETPVPSGTIEGTIEDTQYGPRFKKSTEYNKNAVSSNVDRNNPDVRKEIIRQNSLTNAVSFCIAKANLNPKYKLSGEEVFKVATYFAKYSEGLLTVPESDIKDTGESDLKLETDSADNELNFDEIFAQNEQN